MNAHKIVDILLENEEEDFDAYFLAALTPSEAYDLAYSNPELRPQLEPIIAKSTEHSLYYASHVLRGPFPLGEPAIATDAEISYDYALNVLKRKPFPAGEPAIATNAGYSYEYAIEVLKCKPFPLGEPAIAMDWAYACDYAIHVLKGPFPAGEPAIATNRYDAKEYNKKFGTNI